MNEDGERAILDSLRADAANRAARAIVLRRALILYGIALDAHAAGNRLAILAPDDTIVHEVVGHGIPAAEGGDNGMNEEAEGRP